jgi:hypothetical protein
MLSRIDIMPVSYTLIALNLLSIYICYQTAKSRNANTRFWGWMAVLLGPFAIPLVLLSKAVKK